MMSQSSSPTQVKRTSSFDLMVALCDVCTPNRHYTCVATKPGKPEQTPSPRVHFKAPPT